METKRCSKCGRELPLSEFHKNVSKEDGLSSWCKGCNNKHSNLLNYTPNYDGYKLCTKCKKLLPKTDFRKDRKCRDGLKCSCKECENARNHSYYKTERGKAVMKANYNSERSVAYRKSERGKKLSAERQRRYRNTDKYKEYKNSEEYKRKHYDYTHTDEFKNKQKERCRKCVADMVDYYIKERLVKRGFQKEEINEEIMSYERMSISVKRAIKAKASEIRQRINN